MPMNWSPRTEAELQACADNGLLEETHWLDLKRELESGNSANKKLACDIAAFALDGGTILIGVDEDTSPPSLWPVPLDGLAERVEQIARMRVEEAVQVRTVAIDSTAQPGYGYLVVHIPASVRAPHMTDGRYYGRGDKTNRTLPNVEVVRLLDRRLADRRDLREVARSLRSDLVGDAPLLVVVAEPAGASEDLLVPLTESPQWQNTVFELVHAATSQDQKRYSPSLADASGFARRPGAVAATTGMYDGRRFEGNDRAAEIMFTESGRLVLASERAVANWSFGHISPPPPDAMVVFEALILGNLGFLARIAAAVGQRWGFTSTWRFALSMNGLRGSSSLTLVDRRFGDRGPTYTEDVYERAAEASLMDLQENPSQVVNSLAAPLLRSLGSYGAFSDVLKA
ncbi:Divergent AAA domain [Mycobacteroides abscessus]|nr:Divergent AAA domain [Mycobacteroides abscessus]SKJ88739.1 Divergent AAA domain [Mycobacteroides abscessus subsp. massiliense]CPU61981.1 Divergent AAA domain [Mycobacteroides abscessus]SKP97466.1 Divergent AAA domain [Mycobacteroides abscessus subsp. massiliense]SKV60777.1 Divergent AAA domain [Mycobacteroides abscessus subsp. massiliense]